MEEFLIEQEKNYLIKESIPFFQKLCEKNEIKYVDDCEYYPFWKWDHVKNRCFIEHK